MLLSYDPYNTNLKMPVDLDLQGWNGQHYILLHAIQEIKPTIIVDVGVWKGQSTIYFAQHAPDAHIFAVDTFCGSREHWSMMPFPAQYWQFLCNVKCCKFQDRVTPIPQTSTAAASILLEQGIKPDLIHIDASHDYADVLADLEAWSKFGCTIICDDYVGMWPQVVSAVDYFVDLREYRMDVCRPKCIIYVDPKVKPLNLDNTDNL